MNELQMAIIFPYLPFLGFLLALLIAEFLDSGDDDDQDGGTPALAWSKG